MTERAQTPAAFSRPIWTGCAAIAVVAVVTFAACFVQPARGQGRDTVAGRVGAATVACNGSFDLASVAWVREAAAKHQAPYFATDGTDGAIVSIFGRGPAALGALALQGLVPGQTVTDRDLRYAVRWGAAAAVALSALLLGLALLAFASPVVAAGLALAAGVSFAGSPSLGQGLWQQTACLPFLVATLPCLAWSRRFHWLLLGVPALLGVALLQRPALGGLAFGLGIAWILCVRAAPDPTRIAAWAGAVALVAIAPLVRANLVDFGSPLPLGQFTRNQAWVDEPLAQRPTRFFTGMSGLLVSPARGILWYAPLVPAAVWLGWRTKVPWVRALGLGVLLHFCLAAVFHNWSGGIAFGPRLLAEAAWIAPFLAIAGGLPSTRRVQKWLAALAVWTVAVGALGTWRYDPRAWDLRRLEEKGGVWDVIDNPLIALMTQPRHHEPLVDAPRGPFLYCAPQALGNLPASESRP